MDPKPSSVSPSSASAVPSFSFFEMTSADIPEAAALDALCTPSPWTEDALRRELAKPDARCRLAKSGRRLAGFLVAWHLPGESQLAELAVHPDFRRQGLARRLLREMLEDARVRCAATATLEVRRGNAPAIGLYESLGFASTGVRPKFYEGREDAILMTKSLGTGH